VAKLRVDSSAPARIADLHAAAYPITPTLTLRRLRLARTPPAAGGPEWAPAAGSHRLSRDAGRQSLDAVEI